tara:strand:+ start:127 stop:2835 length:2709 start_codon:yes stop_codon:yes gene_type:complete
MTSKNNELYLIDGMALIYRAHFALIRQPLFSSGGKPTSAIFGFMNMLLKLIKEQSPAKIAIVLDSKEPTFRHELFTDYKATREKMPDDLSVQLEPLFEILSATRIPMIKCPGYEADDIIGTLAKQADEMGVVTKIVSGDKDLMQLITENVFMFTPGNSRKPDVLYDREGVIEKWGVPPERIIDLMALTGDSSDNIPGVKGVGPKTGKKLLDEFDTFDNLIDNIEEIKNPRVMEKVRNDKDLAILSKQLVTIDLDVPIELNIDDLNLQQFDVDVLVGRLKEFELNSIVEKIYSLENIESDHKIEKVEKDYKTILDKTSLDKMVAEIKQAELISFDTETTSLNAHKAELVGMSFSIKEHSGWYVPIDYPDEGIKSDLSIEYILDSLKPFFEDESNKICGQNLKYDALVLNNYNIHLNGIYFDTMVAAHLLKPESNSLKLDSLSQYYLSYSMQPIEDLIGTGKDQKKMNEASLEEVAFYAVEDADVVYQLVKKFKPLLKENNIDKPFYSIDMPLVSVLIDMEKNGAYLDMDFLSDLSDQFNNALRDLEDKIYAVSESEFNINSPKQLAEVLFDQLELKMIKKRSTDVNVLKVLKNHHPLPQFILDYRQYKKLLSTYIDAFPNHINPNTDRVHTTFNQTIASTGRLSSTKPNFQNIPIRTDLGKEIRKAFVPKEKGWQIVSMDYSQVELRIMAHFANEETLIDAFQNDKDIHSQTASLVYGIPIDWVDADQRRTAKVVNFGIMYGAGPYRMSQELNISMVDAKGIIETYFKTYPGIKSFIDSTVENAKANGYVSTLLGRRRNTQNIMSSRQQIVNAEIRAAINMPIQGTAAELIKLAMIHIQDEILKRNMKSKMILQIHDELLFESPEDEIDDLINMATKKMESAMKLSVPLKVDTGIGDNWFDAH